MLSIAMATNDAIGICLITDLLTEPLDEGMNRFVYQVAVELSNRFAFRAVTNTNRPISAPWLECGRFGKWFVERWLAQRLADLGPRHGIYIPHSALTDASMFRAWRLQRLAPKTQWHVVGLQWRHRTAFGHAWGRASRALFYAPSQRMVDQMTAEGLRTCLLPAGVDLQKFRPPTPEQRMQARADLGVPPASFVVAHVGPLRSSRNPDWFHVILAEPDVHLLLVCSTTHPAERNLLSALQGKRVTICNQYLPAIEKVYQAADVYLFPVISPTGAMEWPLSVLEALATGIPVVATPFGALPEIKCQSVIIVDNPAELSPALKRIRGQTGLGRVARQWAEQHSWPSALQNLIKNLRA